MKGVIEVSLKEDNGFIQLYGMPVDSKLSDSSCSCSQDDEDETCQEFSTSLQSSSMEMSDDPRGQNQDGLVFS